VTLKDGSSCDAPQCADCALGQTCDARLGVCQGAAIVVAASETSNQTDSATTSGIAGPTQTADRDAWVVAVAVTVPVVVLCGVAVALLIVFLMRRKQARYDSTTNAQLRENQLHALRTNAHD
jgi:hypothetical protein